MIIDALITVVNMIIASIGGLLSMLVNLLPLSPFKIDAIQNINTVVQDNMSTFNWFVPVDAILGVTVYWLMAIAAYYVISVAMRWAKMIE